MAAACGDDDGGDGAGGGGGTGAAGGSAGAGGGGGTSAGEGGGGGSAGSSAGSTSGGAGGSAGSGTAGTGGAAGSGTAGSGTVEPPDAGPDGGEADASPDSGGPVTVPDSGVNGDCAGFTTGIPNIDPQNSQDVVIARVIFNPDGVTATAVLRGINPFGFGGDHVICWGANNSTCAGVDDGISGDESPAGAEILVTVGTPDDPIEVDEGELWFGANFPEEDPIVFAYVNWGDHDSEDADDGGPILSLEGMADAAGFWTVGDSIELDGDDNAFFGFGDTAVGAGFDGCTADQFPVVP